MTIIPIRKGVELETPPGFLDKEFIDHFNANGYREVCTLLHDDSYTRRLVARIEQHHKNSAAEFDVYQHNAARGIERTEINIPGFYLTDDHTLDTLLRARKAYLCDTFAFPATTPHRTLHVESYDITFRQNAPADVTLELSIENKNTTSPEHLLQQLPDSANSPLGLIAKHYCDALALSLPVTPRTHMYLASIIHLLARHHKSSLPDFVPTPIDGDVHFIEEPYNTLFLTRNILTRLAKMRCEFESFNDPQDGTQSSKQYLHLYLNVSTP